MFRRVERPIRGIRRSEIIPPKRPALPLQTVPPTEGPFAGYRRTLTPEGGIRIDYRDIDARWRWTLLRIGVWIGFTGVGYETIVHLPPFESWWIKPACILAIGIASWLIVRTPIKVMRSIEIRPDRMILESADEFWLEKMGDNWPVLEPDEDNLDEDAPDKFVLGGIYGTRFVKYLTSHRVDKFDRTPEVLAADLKNAMDQLWGRTELVFGRPSP